MDCAYIHQKTRQSLDRHLKIMVWDELLEIQTAVPSTMFGDDECRVIDATQLDTRDDFHLNSVKIPTKTPGEEFDPSLTGEELCIFPMAYISLPYLKSRYEWKDHCNWDIIPQGDYGPIHYFRNTTADSAFQRRHYRDIPYTLGLNTLLSLYVPFACVESFAEMGVRALLLSANSRLISNVTWTEMQRTPDGMFPRVGLYPTFDMAGPDTITPDGVAEISITPVRWGEVVQKPLQVELETINGYLPKTRLNTTGTSSFKVHALGLEPGDTIKVKAGFRFYPGIGEHIIKVVE